ncbi:ecto-NOX disulfide-thiol exchanger 2 [Coccinella septempunctata]|uniref:ecto-NOX disulfide-thiol exchanger 2 n=1 Tax=Coccinella septempunctata TaxID=41139 RepID=UPI001D065189|nr:ecto-NOX disulfide-thiol exchanger 2 [Coccinella septempunctata]
MFSGGISDRPLEFTRAKIMSKSSLEDKDDTAQSPPEKKDFRKRSRDRRDTDKSREDSDSNMSNSQDVIPLANSTIWSSMMGLNYPMMNMIMDPSLISMGNYSMMPSIMSSDSTVVQPDNGVVLNPVKEIIHCKSCTLFPPNPNAPLPSTRERPPGCKTVFVGGLPENITEEIIMEVFDRCGEITTLRLSKKNFCHIRFMYEACIDAAIYLSGFRIRIGSNSDPANTGRLHVDYAQARDDQYEWECKQRQLQREQRHRERMEEERLRPPSPPPVVHYTDHEAASVAEKIKQDETFTKAVQIVVTWLERGDCNKRNSNNFYSMIQSTNSHVRRLLSEKCQYEDELKKAKEIMKGRMQGILLQFSQIERLFVAACHKKVWDHFTKAQRKNIEMWKKQSMEIKNVQLDEIRNEKADDEMDVSDEDEPTKKKIRSENSNNELNALKEENESLKCQMEAYKNEVEVLKIDYKKEFEEKEKQFKVLQQTLIGMQQQLSETKKKHTEEELKTKELQAKLKAKVSKNTSTSDKEIIDLDPEPEQQDASSNAINELNISSTSSLEECDIKLIGIISTFLNVHPFGAGLDYIWSYVSKFGNTMRPSDIELLMSRYPSVFKQKVMGVGANIERKWFFNGFSSAD